VIEAAGSGFQGKGLNAYLHIPDKPSKYPPVAGNQLLLENFQSSNIGHYQSFFAEPKILTIRGINFYVPIRMEKILLIALKYHL
jgi:hypothetical protein